MYYINKFGSLEKVVVYDITYDTKDGFPQFLTYIDGQWIRKSAKHFRPID
jgi:hypothetical protein